MNQRYTVPMTYILHLLPAYRVHAYVSVVARGLNTSTSNAVATATLSKRERGYHSQRGQRRLGDLQGVRDGGRAGRADLVGCLRSQSSANGALVTFRASAMALALVSEMDSRHSYSPPRA